jgi:hypothetical protein
MPDPYAAAATVRDLIAVLTEAATRLPAGLDTPVRFGICDGTDLHLLDDVDVDVYTVHPQDPADDPRHLLLARGHQHPGRAGEVWRGAGAAQTTNSAASPAGRTSGRLVHRPATKSP